MTNQRPKIKHEGKPSEQQEAVYEAIDAHLADECRYEWSLPLYKLDGTVLVVLHPELNAHAYESKELVYCLEGRVIKVMVIDLGSISLEDERRVRRQHEFGDCEDEEN